MRFSRPSNLTLLVTGLVIIAALLRMARHFQWLPLPPNVAPIAAMAMVSGIFLPRRLTFVVPLAAMVLSDVVIGFYTLPVMIAVYVSFAVCNLAALNLRNRLSFVRLICTTLLGSMVFFAVTNAAVWQFEHMYAHTAFGLWQSYLAGLPFFRNTLLGDLGYTILFVGSAQAVMVYLARRPKYAVNHG